MNGFQRYHTHIHTHIHSYDVPGKSGAATLQYVHDAEHMHIMWQSILHYENINFKITI